MDSRREWDNLIVSPRVWEPRQPQDFVRGVRDDQAVQNARPLGPNIEVGPLYYQLQAPAGIGATTIDLGTSAYINPGDPVRVMLDSGEFFLTTCLSTNATGCVLASGLPNTAASGNDFVDTADRIPALV